jgi:CHASE2 domain-containing sensor protein
LPRLPAEDQALERAIRKAGNVILVSDRTVVDDLLFLHTIRVDSIPAFKQVAQVGVTTLRIDPDGTVRRALLLSSSLPSFPAQIVRRYLAPRTRGIHPAEWKRWSKVELSKEVLINYLGPPRTVKTVSYHQALDYERMLPPRIFTDKIVLVGRSIQADSELQSLSPDTFLTSFSLTAGGPTSGLEIQATLVYDLLQERPRSQGQER